MYNIDILKQLTLLLNGITRKLQCFIDAFGGSLDAEHGGLLYVHAGRGVGRSPTQNRPHGNLFFPYQMHAPPFSYRPWVEETEGRRQFIGFELDCRQGSRLRGDALVLAGAGSGKTRVLTHRIAHLIHNGVHPSKILAITFTNKAAAEMRERVGALVGPVVKTMWVSTFHSACVRILRANADVLGYPRQFSIYDAADSNRLTGYVIRDLGLDSKRFTPRGVHGLISLWKNELVDPAEAARRLESFSSLPHRLELVGADLPHEVA